MREVVCVCGREIETYLRQRWCMQRVTREDGYSRITNGKCSTINTRTLREDILFLERERERKREGEHA